MLRLGIGIRLGARDKAIGTGAKDKARARYRVALYSTRGLPAGRMSIIICTYYLMRSHEVVVMRSHEVVVMRSHEVVITGLNLYYMNISTSIHVRITRND